MDPRHLQALFPDVDIDAALADFQASTGSMDNDQFVGWLRDKGHIDVHGFTRAHACATLELGSTMALPDDDRAIDPTLDRERGASGLDPAASERYQLLGSIGEGSHGEVHVAKDLELRRKVALKRLRAADVRKVSRFVTEAQITAQLDHPNIVPVYGLEVSGQGVAAYTMKLVEGRTLRQVIDAATQAAGDSREALATRLEHLLKCCDAVAFAHDKGVIHRDLKPANVMIGRFGEVFVMDWGIARVLSLPEPEMELPDATTDAQGPVDVTPENRTRVGAVMGTPAFMAPEQAAGDAEGLSPATDVYALGLILYEIVTLRRAYGGRSVDEILERARAGLKRPARTPKGAPPLEPDLLAIIDKATALDPADRYSNARWLAADLRRLLRGDETQALPDTPMRRLKRWMTRHTRATLGIMAALVVVGALGMWWSHLQQRASLAEERLESSAREDKVAGFVNRVAEQAQRIANDFLYYGGLTEGLAASSRQALLRGKPNDAPIYTPWDFEDGGRPPPDAAHSDRYGVRISLGSPITHVAPGVDHVTGEGALRRLLGITDVLRDTLVSGPDAVWAYVATQAEGAIAMYPGARGTWTHEYDPRLRSWYREAAVAFKAPDRRARRVWSSPYLDLMGQGLVISCLQPFADEEGELAGVAALDLGFQHVVARHIALPTVPGFAAGWLLDREGRVMVTTEQVGEPPMAPDGTVDFGWFPDPDVVAAVRAGRSGQRQSSQGRLLAWSRLQHLDWTFVAAVDRAALLAADVL